MRKPRERRVGTKRSQKEICKTKVLEWGEIRDGLVLKGL